MKQTKKLKDIAIISAGQSAPQGKNNYSSEGIPFVKAGNLVELIDGAAESSIQKVSEMVAKEHKLKLYQPGTVLFAKSGMSCMKGYVYQLKSPCYVVSHLACITVTEISGEYLKYYFEYHRPNSLVKDEAYPSISLVDIGDMEISYGNRQEQKEAVIFLNAIQKIIKQRREEIKKLDDLVKSQFIEMFGTIPKDRYAPLDRVCKIITDGTHQPPQFSNSGIPFLFVSNLANNEINYQTQKFISKDTYKELIKRTPIQIGDVLLSTVGSYGHPAVVTDDREFCFQRHIAYFKPNPQMIDSRFLYGALLSPIGQEQIERAVKGIAQKTLNLSEIRKIRIPLPSYEHQKQYSAFYEQTDKSKVLIREHLFLINRLRKVEKT